MPKSKNGIYAIIIALIILFFMSISRIATFVTDYFWFDALGFKKIFMITLETKILLFFISVIIFLVFMLVNLAISTRLNKSIIAFKIKLLVSLVLALFVGMSSSQKWFTVLQYFHQVPFNLTDPIFLKEVSFYIFSLPFMLAVWDFALACVVLTIIVVLIDYLQSFIVDSIKQPKVQMFTPDMSAGKSFKTVFQQLKQKALVHLSVLASFFFILLAIKHYLERFSIMYSEKGIVVGAGYTDVMAFLPLVKVLMVLAIFMAALFYIWIFIISKRQKLRKRHILAIAVVIYFIAFLIVPGILTGIIQNLVVSPNEINLEKPYIENNIKFTRIAYGLSDVEEKDFSVEMVTLSAIENASETMENVRILDWRPLMQTYKQTQEIRLYYDLSGIDIDRYEIDGKYTEVMLAPREMNQKQIAENAKTWVNLHMIYTHGYGVVMSPVNSVTKQGLPNYLIKDIPPIYNVDEETIRIDKPQIYYGENDNEFILANTGTEEFDYPKGNSNEYIQYDGAGGILLNSFFKKLFMAIRFSDIKILLSSDVNAESRILFDRQIQERISKITPFLILDHDPYLVIDNGKLFWIQDAYTVTGNFPYSQKFGRINYMRNSLKIVVDAYDGDVTYYVVDIDDPLLVTYSRIFPKQFKSFDMMPEGLKQHIRYPEDLFKVQADIYSTYHMNDVTVFYNKEDAWQIPFETYGTGQKVKVDPYYIIIKLPGENEEEFVLMSSFTPIRKDNMIAWMAARSDNENYGKLLLYKFPKDKLVYGPLQIEAKFDQDSEISQQLTLWSQQGSRITRGNLLVIPIKNSLLYIEPLYIQAETGQLPELKRVLVSDGERVVMEENLDIALEVLFGKKKPTPKPVEAGTESQTNQELIAQAQEYYDMIIESMGNNWTAFGENFDKLGDVLGRLE